MEIEIVKSMQRKGGKFFYVVYELRKKWVDNKWVGIIRYFPDLKKFMFKHEPDVMPISEEYLLKIGGFIIKLNKI